MIQVKLVCERHTIVIETIDQREEHRKDMHGNSDSAHGHTRAVVWIDHLTAKVFTMGITGVTSTAVDAQLESWRELG